jgi:histidine triad (HIT) family protein
MNDCIFCKIIKGEIPSFKVYEDEKVLAFEDINPISPGHTLVIPKVHAENIWDIDENDLVALQRASKKIAGAIKKALEIDGIACMQLNGRAAHQEVMHYHLHLVPRKADGPPLPITSWEIKPGNMEAIKARAERIKAALL